MKRASFFLGCILIAMSCCGFSQGAAINCGKTLILENLTASVNASSSGLAILVEGEGLHGLGKQAGLIEFQVQVTDTTTPVETIQFGSLIDSPNALVGRPYWAFVFKKGRIRLTCGIYGTYSYVGTLLKVHLHIPSQTVGFVTWDRTTLPICKSCGLEIIP